LGDSHKEIKAVIVLRESQKKYYSLVRTILRGELDGEEDMGTYNRKGSATDTDRHQLITEMQGIRAGQLEEVGDIRGHGLYGGVVI